MTGAPRLSTDAVDELRDRGLYDERPDPLIPRRSRLLAAFDGISERAAKVWTLILLAATAAIMGTAISMMLPTVEEPPIPTTTTTVTAVATTTVTATPEPAAPPAEVGGEHDAHERPQEAPEPPQSDSAYEEAPEAPEAPQWPQEAPEEDIPAESVPAASDPEPDQTSEPVPSEPSDPAGPPAESPAP